jgi:hypothetical protein
MQGMIGSAIALTGTATVSKALLERRTINLICALATAR